MRQILADSPVGAFRDIESANYDPETGVLRVLSERSRRVYEIGLTVDPKGELELRLQRRRRRLKRVQCSANSGYEGFTTLPARVSPDGRKWSVAPLSPQRLGPSHSD